MAANELIEAVPRMYAPYSDDLSLSDSGRESPEPGQESEAAGGHDTHGRPGPDDHTDLPGND